MFNAQEFLKTVRERDPNQDQFLQTADEVVTSLESVINGNPKYIEQRILDRMIEPERVISFRVEWIDDSGVRQTNRGFRVQYSSVLGPYKGGLRFHPSVNLSILKFLGFEQIFKNSLTGLPLGGGKGGSDFDPKGKSIEEIKRFCEAFMTELAKYIGPGIDVPAGDIGVSGREIKFMADHYGATVGEKKGILSGMPIEEGGIRMRTEATGYGLVYFTAEMLATKSETFEGKRVLVSGSGNVAQYAIEKATELGAIVLTASDSGGYILDEEGIDSEKLNFIKELKNEKRGRIKEYIEKYPNATYHEGERPWAVKADIALPCATQNEIDENDAKTLLGNGVSVVAEGSNMPSTNEAAEEFLKADILYGPAKASNAGGVGVSGLEIEMHGKNEDWTDEQVDDRLKGIMKHIHEVSVRHGTQEGRKTANYVAGANVAGFIRVAESMLS